MSTYYFTQKWKETLSRLDNIIELDLEYQKIKTHDQKQCHAVQRLAGVLGEWIVVYNDAVDCLHHNLQPQKNKHIRAIVKAIMARVLELKQQLRKLESSNYQFLGQGLIEHKLTTYNTELTELPKLGERSSEVNKMIDDVFEKVREKKAELAKKVEEAEMEIKKEAEVRQWWDDEVENNNENPNDENASEIHEKEISEEISYERKLVTLLQAHEKSRKVILYHTQEKQKRERWTKELEGTLHLEARSDVRERAAAFIQKICRAYFELKRNKVRDCKRDELLGIRVCKKRSTISQEKNEELKKMFLELNKQSEEEWTSRCEKMKHDYLLKRSDDISEDFRDLIRDWFQKWFNEIQCLYNIPNENEGGSILILKDEVPSPLDWLEEYKLYMEEKKANKNKTAMQLKWEKMEAKKDEMKAKKEELMKKILEEALRKKIMKNPNLHPGYNYPESKKTEQIVTALENYRRNWTEADLTESFNFKERDVEEICKDAKIEVLKVVDEDMREEFKTLKKALKTDYKRNGEQMPETIMKQEKQRKKKRKLKLKLTSDENIAEKMEHLAITGILQEYPRTKLVDYAGDYNYAGDDLRCMYKQIIPFAGETRHIWWERCEEMTHGFQRILLVGPAGSGKTVLVHALATINDATLFQLDPATMQNEILSYAELQNLINSITLCAQVTQPSVIYIKNVNRFYEKKVFSEDAYVWNQMKRQFLRKVIKKIHKSDKIAIIGTCIEPWVIKSKRMLKQFPTVVLSPATSYSTVMTILQDWIVCNRLLLSNLDIQSLTYMLQGYRFGFIKKTLDDFLTPDRIIEIAARGLFSEDIYNFFIENDEEDKVEYDKYLKWYFENTYWGKKEMKRIEEEREFQTLSKKFAEKKKAKPPMAPILESNATDVKDEQSE